MAETAAPEAPPPPHPEQGPAVLPEDGEERGSGTSSSSSPGAADSRSLEAKHGLSISIPAAANSGFPVGAGAFSQLLAGAMAFSPGNLGVASPGFASPVGLALSPGFTGRFAMTHQEALATVTAQAHMKLQAGYRSPSLSFYSPTLSPLSLVPKEQIQLLSSNENKVSSDSAQLPVSKAKTQSSRIVIKTHSDDGYNWRKYGQKLLKSNDVIRSYYRCTHPDCSAKRKVVHFQDGNITDVSYKGQHNHDEPKKKNYLAGRESQSGEHLKVNEIVNPSDALLNELGSYTIEREHNLSNETPKQLDHANDCDAGPSKDAEDLGREPYPKRRLRKVSTTRSSLLIKPSKERKTILHTACDSGLAYDGFRWRKYGQKIVKGNPNPRSYYRCTQSGCPGRKHVERASQDENAFIVTYEGNHNHDI